jgi:hypothetical protein
MVTAYFRPPGRERAQNSAYRSAPQFRRRERRNNKWSDVFRIEPDRIEEEGTTDLTDAMDQLGLYVRIRRIR